MHGPRHLLDDFHGKQIRVGSASDLAIVEGLGASPVSMQFTETYEALQRNTIDCTLGGLRIGSEYGFLEVAPHVTYPEDAAWGRSPTAVVAGPGYTNLPLAAQQLIFDSYAQSNAGSLEASTAFVADAVTELQEKGGDIVRLEPDANDALQDAVDGLREKTCLGRADGEDAANRLTRPTEVDRDAEEEGHVTTGTTSASRTATHPTRSTSRATASGCSRGLPAAPSRPSGRFERAPPASAVSAGRSSVGAMDETQQTGAQQAGTQRPAGGAGDA